MLYPHTHILETIQLIRDSFDGSEIVYTRGSCVKLAMILKHIYPEGQILYDLNHAIFQYGKNCFDINGFAEQTDAHKPLEDYGLLHAYKSMNLKYNITPALPITGTADKKY